MVACSIIALVATAGFFSVGFIRSKVRDARRVADINEMMKALSLYQNSVSAYPVSTGTCITGSDVVSSALIAERLVSRVPADPIYTTEPNCYYYVSASGNSYILRYYLEINSSSGTQGLHTVTP